MRLGGENGILGCGWSAELKSRIKKSCVCRLFLYNLDDFNMKLSLRHLRQFVDLRGFDDAKIGEKLTVHTAELEEILPQKPFFDRVFAGKMLEVRPHADSTKLSVAIFDLGRKIGKKQIVFGKIHEVSVGEILPIAIAGAKLRSGIEISDSKIRGERSEGMIADNLELGMKNPGLLRFSDKKLIGKSLPEICAEFEDVLFDIDNKSLTHRPDLMGHRGFALELSAIFGRKLILPEPLVSVPDGLAPVPVEIRTEKCRRFCALKLENVVVEPSALEIRVRLENLGIRGISNFVDATNFVMIDHGQPMHAFDADKIEGKIIVRQAKNGEKLLALDGEEYELDDSMIVVADEAKVLSIAGIMGGAESGVDEKTKAVIFESANFDPVAVRKTSAKLGLRSESSMRFEKSLDPWLCKKALFAAVEMALEFCPEAKIASACADENSANPEPKIIPLDPARVRKYAGLDLPDAEIRQKLESIHFRVDDGDPKNWKITVPSNRATKDVSIPEDLIEEVVRLHGFSDISGTLPDLPIAPPPRNFQRELEWKIRDFFATRGFLEAKNYSFASDFDRDFDGNPENFVEVENPLSADQKFCRTNLISNFIKNLESELRTHRNLDFFEIGSVFSVAEPSGNAKSPTAERKNGDSPIVESTHFSALSAEIGGDEVAKFFALKSDLSAFFDSLGLKFEIRERTKRENYAHPARGGDVFLNGAKIGTLAVLHPKFAPAEGAVIVFFELDLPPVVAATKKTEKKYAKISPFPRVRRDLSLILPEKVLISEVESVARESSPILREIELFDEFFDEKKFGAGRKNLAFHLEFQSENHTLTDEEIDENFQKIVHGTKSRFGSELRSEFDSRQKK